MYLTYTHHRRTMSAGTTGSQEGSHDNYPPLRQERFVVVAADTLGAELRRLLPSRAIVVAEGGGWSAILPGVPAHGDADSFDAAIDDLIDALRNYAEDWNGRLFRAPNHAQHRSLVELVELSGDAQLREWLVGSDQAREATADALA